MKCAYYAMKKNKIKSFRRKQVETKWDWKKFLYTSPISITFAITLGFGGLILFIFFTHLKFLPDFDLASSTAVLASIALIGIFVLLYIGITAVMPGIATQQLIETANIKTFKVWSISALIAPAIVLIALILLEGYKVFDWLNTWSTSWFMCFAFSLSLLLSVVAIYKGSSQFYQTVSLNWKAIWFFIIVSLGTTILFTFLAKFDGVNAETSEQLVFGIYLLLLLLGLLWSSYVGWKQYQLGGPHLPIFRRPWALAGSLWFASIIWVIGIFFTFYLYIVFSRGSGRSEAELLTFSFGWLLLATAINLGISSLSATKALRSGLLAGATAVFFLIFLTGNFSTVPVMAVRAMGLGEIFHARVVLTLQGCQAFNHAVGSSACTIHPNHSSASVCPVTIKSRIGGQILLEWEPEIANTETAIKSLPYRIVLNKSDMLAWTSMPEKDASKSEAKSPSNAATTQEKNRPEKKKDEKKLEKISALFCAPYTETLSTSGKTTDDAKSPKVSRPLSKSNEKIMRGSKIEK